MLERGTHFNKDDRKTINDDVAGRRRRLSQGSWFFDFEVLCVETVTGFVRERGKITAEKDSGAVKNSETLCVWPSTGIFLAIQGLTWMSKLLFRPRLEIL